MKATKLFLAAAVVLTSASLAGAQEKTDSIKVFYEPVNPVPHGGNTEYYLDSLLLKGFVIDAVKPVNIEKIDVVKGDPNKIYITLKKGSNYNFVSLKSLSNKYLKNKKTTALLYTVDGKLIPNAESLINEKEILSVSVAADQMVSSLPEVKVTMFKVLTRSKENIENAKRIYIRGNATGAK